MMTAASGKNARRGFSLIELSAIISVAAAVAVGYLSWTQPKQRTFAEKTRVTLGRMNELARAIEAFKVKHGRLPCPADPFQRSDGTRAEEAPAKVWESPFGVENMDRSEEDDNETLGEDCPFNEGAPPVFSLELTEDAMLDGWGRRFTYRVSNSLCGADPGVKNGVPKEVSRNRGCTVNDYGSNAGDIIIDDPEGRRLNSNAAYVILSHGSNGYGAFLPSGARLAFPPQPPAAEMANADGYSFTKPAAFNASAMFVKGIPAAEGYDDVMLFRTRAQLESLTRDDNRRLMTKESCQEVSGLIASNDFNALLTAADANVALNKAIQRGKSASASAALMMIMDTIQRLCGKYYGYSTADYKCPKGAAWDASLKVCKCASGDWDAC